jgi:hypothetical protein
MTRTRLLTLALLATVACSDDPTGPGAGTDLAFDVATVAADATAEDVDIMAGMDGEIGFLTGTASISDGIPNRPGVAGCNFVGGRFMCPRGQHAELSVDREVTFLDAGGTAQAAYDALTTASIEIDVTIMGEIDRGPWDATIERSRELTITGLEGTETTRLVNGSGTESVTGSRHVGNGNGNSGQGNGNTPRSYTLEGTTEIEDVVVPVRGEGVAPWPLSGTVTRVFTITPTGTNGGDPVTKTIVVTFNGTANVTATLDGEEFTLNLAARRAVRRN